LLILTSVISTVAALSVAVAISSQNAHELDVSLARRINQVHAHEQGVEWAGFLPSQEFNVSDSASLTQVDGDDDDDGRPPNTK